MNAWVPVLSADAVRAAEATAPELLGDGTLMARAAFAVATHCLGALRRGGGVVGRQVLLLVGGGDNGGDALFAGAVLARRGVRVLALPLAERIHSQALQALLAAGGRSVDVVEAFAALADTDLVIDGIVGLGSSRALEGDAARVAQAVSDCDVFTVAIDVPSGVHVDTGAVTGAAIHADETLTFGALRYAHVVAPAALRCGRITVIDIDVPMQSQDRALLAEGRWFDAPPPGADKYSRGVVGVVTGSNRYPGAALLSVGAAQRSGCGMVRYFGSVGAAVTVQHPEVVVAPDSAIASARCQSWVIGCGSGTEESSQLALAEVLMHEAPVVADADAITMLAHDQHLRALLTARAERGCTTLLTPHAGELDRLAGGLGLVVDIAGDRLEAAKAVARALQAVVLLKGPTTLITDGQRFIATLPLGAQLATAGSGDVLAGLLGGAIARWQADGRLSVAQIMELAGACALRHASAAADHDTVASDLLVGLEHHASTTMTP